MLNLPAPWWTLQPSQPREKHVAWTPRSHACKAPLADGVRCRGSKANRCPRGQEKFCHSLSDICSPPNKCTCFKDILGHFPSVHFGVSVTFSLYWTRNPKARGLVWAKLNLQPKQDWFCEVALGSLVSKDHMLPLSSESCKIPHLALFSHCCLLSKISPCLPKKVL